MKFRQRYTTAFVVLLSVAANLIFSSCTDKISSIGSPYVKDTVNRGSAKFSDDSSLRYVSILKQTVRARDLPYNINYSSPYLMVGAVSSEGLAVWSVLKMPILPDSVGTLLDDSLILAMHNAFFYGPDPGSTQLSFAVYMTNNASDSTATLSTSDLLGAPVGQYDGTLDPDSVRTIAVQLDTARIFAAVRTSSLALVLVPSPSMNAIRAFASDENGTASLVPTMKYLVASATGNYTTTRIPDYDFHVVTETMPPPQGTFELRGSRALRERFVIDMKHIVAALKLNPFVSVNSALLQVTAVPGTHSFSALPVDSSLPVLIYRDSTTADSVGVIASYGAYSPSDPNVIEYQIQTSVEYAVRHGLDSLVFDLMPGYGYRSIGGSGIYVEDYNVARWFFDGSDATDAATKPRLVLIYSYLQ